MVGERKGKAILIGLSGGIDSMVAAYLLRIQKREVFGVIFASTPEDFQDHGEHLFACHQTDGHLAAVKKFCEHLQIPLTVLRPREEFESDVIAPWVATRATARKPRLCQDCHRLRMELLFRHAQTVGCEKIASGHYAKLSHNPDGTISVHSSNDIAADQSGLLASLPQELLQVLELPLSELQQKEVRKIAENFQLIPPARLLKPGGCLPLGSEPVETWLAAHLPKSMQKEGEVILIDHMDRVGLHNGLYHFEVGGVWKKAVRQGDKEIFSIGMRWPKKELLVSGPEWFVDRGIQLQHCHWGEGTDLSAPVHGYIHKGEGLADLEVIIYPKTQNGAWVELVEGEDRFVPGEDLLIFKRKGKNAKVVLTGQIGRSMRHWPSNTIPVPNDEKKKDGPTEIDKDFNF